MRMLRNLLLGAALFIAILAAPGCGRNDLIKIGFVGGLTGRVADLGIAGRDGVILAIEEKNRAGGIDGRLIELLVRDDRQDPVVAARVDRELIDAGVAAIIGHMTSAMSVAAVPVVNERGILMISPTTSTNELRGLDDHFFRVYPCSAQTSRKLAEYVYETMGLRRVAVVYDIKNRAHTESAFIPFREEFESRGGKIVMVDTFLSGPDVSFSDIAKHTEGGGADCMYILANAMDTAILCQQLYKQGRRMQVVGSDWSMTSDIVEFGGRSVGGLFAMHTVDRSSEEPRYQRFKKAFAERFGRDPDFAAVHAYDSAAVLLKALERNPDPSKLRETIREIGAFEGLQTEISFDEFGDVIREHHPIEIVDGHFVRVK